MPDEISLGSEQACCDQDRRRGRRGRVTPGISGSVMRTIAAFSLRERDHGRMYLYILGKEFGPLQRLYQEENEERVGSLTIGWSSPLETGDNKASSRRQQV